jgi:hypothetical protein
MKKLLTTLALLVALSSCSHDLRVTNLHENYVPISASLNGSKTIGIVSNDKAGYTEAIINSLRNSNNFDKVVYPYNAEHSKKVDYVVNISVNPKYSGSGNNFLVNWPGFLIFAPAIWGYGYKAEVVTDISISELDQSETVKLNYKFRHASINRTWTGVGWLEVGIIPLIGGIYFINYDHDVTPKFINEVSKYYGDNITNKITSLIKSGQ